MTHGVDLLMMIKYGYIIHMEILYLETLDMKIMMNYMMKKMIDYFII
jgi:hypothetical protein